MPRSLSIRFSFEATDGGLYERTMKFWPPPLMIISFSILQICIHFIRYLQFPESSFLYQQKSFSFGDYNLQKIAIEYLKYNSCKRNELWRFVSYMLVHSSNFHLIGNVMLQLLLGVPLELVHKWWRVLLIYFAGILAGSLGYSFVKSCGNLIGVSAGCYALLFAHIANIIMVKFLIT